MPLHDRHSVRDNLEDEDDMKRALDYFKQHPVHTPMTASEASGFHH